ncbi:unnamed protein product [Linum tenue]|uniref:Uncharacterized protein n=1 Tax=Linum tenue TaxID=586396 RepID=A0AAV0HZ48_9ROSI|nr:unnamed protein product [Linum tenue]
MWSPLIPPPTALDSRKGKRLVSPNEQGMPIQTPHFFPILTPVNIMAMKVHNSIEPVPLIDELEHTESQVVPVVIPLAIRENHTNLAAVEVTQVGVSFRPRRTAVEGVERFHVAGERERLHNWPNRGGEGFEDVVDNPEGIFPCKVEVSVGVGGVFGDIVLYTNEAILWWERPAAAASASWPDLAPGEQVVLPIGKCEHVAVFVVRGIGDYGFADVGVFPL